ncbi:MAG TPA: cbb3-type cytochrome c oxidase N-terminal domain-containing protein, partial [Bacteroidia bacterium]|nr:cbb3-type cytochrome c oxidase N-terminal domain-containing protein [Bacteroidia bacterium]
LTLLAIISFSNNLFSQTSVATETTSYMLDDFTFYFMITIILFESFVIWILYNMSMSLLGVKERKRMEAEEKARRSVLESTFIEKINASVAVEKEADILLDHNYDGIRELDNNLPPWWKYGFYFTILFSIAYLINYHVIGTGQLQQEEYNVQLTKAAYDIEAYRKKAANLVDENNATLLTDAASLNSGKSIYIENCAPCHGKLGEGGVGPNLTDAYWIHKGGIKDIFKTIKYGWAEKGMKPWKDDLGAKQIHEVASYIKLMYGTNPPNAKEKQGDLYQDEILNDSIKVAEKVPEHISEGQ